MRKLTKTIALVSLMTPASVLPLGVGDIKLHSTLNENLNAEIALLVSADENPSDIKVKLAPPDKFDEAGVPWSYFLSKIKFDLVTRSDGATVIKLSSAEALREPFLDFLLEVTWPKGNLYREFTVLVDPPATYQKPVVPVSTVSGVSKAAREYARTVEKTAPSVASKSRQAVTEYGPVSRRDTLWTVAEKVNPYSDVSVEQVMMALYEANPKAFYKDNVNALKAGTRLSVPEKEVILKLTRKEALAEFARQNQAWNSRMVAKSEPEKPVAEETVDSQLKLLAPAEVEVAEHETVVSGEQETATPAPAISEPVLEEPLAEGEEQVPVELQKRLEKLEQQLVMMQQMLALKDEQLAALQNKQQVPGTMTSPQPTVSKPEAVTPPPVKPVAPKPQPKPVAQAAPEAEGSDLYYWLLAVLGIGAMSGFGWLWWRKRQVESETDTDSMFAASSEISLPTSTEEQLTVPAMEEGAAYDVGTVGESSFLSEFTPSDFDAFDSDQHEVDPISEADVYLAYGRYQQAEELIRHAIEENPANDDYKLKLLEIFYANENKEAFEKYAEDLIQAGKQDDATFWEKVVEMGSEISPGAALFASGFELKDAGAVQQEAEAKKEPSSQVGDDDLDFDLPSFDEPELDQSESQETEPSADNSLDFDLSSFDSDKNEEVRTERAEQDDHNIEFDLTSDFQAEGAEQEKPEGMEQLKEDEDHESFEFDFSMPESEVKEEVSKREDDSIMKEVDDFTLSIDEAEDAAKDALDLKEAEGDFDFNFDFDMEKPDSEQGGGKGASDMDLGVSDLTDMDEFETKIDLARAYIDMGDAEAAKDIAEEVLEKGNAEQKDAAQAILDELK
ncbi:MAG: FimV/HubP family polar landmark protein [Gammaproteobacteria bacterium]